MSRLRFEPNTISKQVGIKKFGIGNGREMVTFPSRKRNLNPDIGNRPEAKKELARSQTGKTVRRKDMGNFMATDPFKVEMMLEETGDKLKKVCTVSGLMQSVNIVQQHAN